MSYYYIKKKVKSKKLGGLLDPCSHFLGVLCVFEWMYVNWMVYLNGCM